MLNNLQLLPPRSNRHPLPQINRVNNPPPTTPKVCPVYKDNKT